MSVELMEQIKVLAKSNNLNTSKFIQTVMQEYVNQMNNTQTAANE